MADPVLDKPRSFAGDPNPPPESSGIKAPEISTAPVAGMREGTDALPSIPLHTISPEGPTFRIVTHPDETLRGVMTTPDFQSTDTGRVNIDPEDAKAILHASGQFDEATDSWTVDEKTFTALQQGRPNFDENTLKKLEGGEITLVKNGLSLKFFDGEMTAAEYDARIHEEDLKNQLGQQPALAWRGLGKYAADIITHPAETGARVAKFALDSTLHPIDTVEAEAKFVADAVRFVAGEMAEQAPNMREATKANVAGRVAGALSVAAVIPFAPVAAGVMPAASAVGGKIGSLTYFIKQETASSVEDLHKKGFDMATIRKIAPIAGAIKGTLEELSFGVMTAPFKSAIARNVLTSKPVVAAMTAAANTFMKSGTGALVETVAAEITTEEMQTTTDILANNYAAKAENKPNARINFPEMVDQWVQTAAKTFGASLGFGALGAGVTTVSNRIATRAEQVNAAKTEERIKADMAAREGGVPTAVSPAAPTPAEGAASQSAQIAPETPAPTTSAGQPEVVSESRMPSKYQASADSMAGHPTFVKASEEAAKAGVDPANFKAVVDLYDKANNAVHALRMKYGLGPGLKPTEAFKALSETESEAVAVEIADAAMKRIHTEPLAYLLVTGEEYLVIANKNLQTDPAAIEAWKTAKAAKVAAELPQNATSNIDETVAAFNKGEATAEDLVDALPPAAEEATARHALESKATEVVREAAVKAVESDITQVNKDLDEQYKKRVNLAAKGEPLANIDRQINALLDQKETLIKQAADLKTAPQTEIGRGLKLEMKAATLADIVVAGFEAGGKDARAQAAAEMTVATQEFNAAKGELRAAAKERLDIAKAKFDALAERVKSRPRMLKKIADENGLSGAETTQLIRSLARTAAPALMTDKKFDEFVAEFKAKAEHAKEWKAARKDLAAVLKEKALVNESRLRKVRDLPISRKMTTEQIRQYIEVLKDYEKNDEILTAKRIEVLKNTEFAGVDTMRALAEKAAAYLKKPLAALAGAKVTEWSVFTPDTQLAAQHPFFEYMVRRAKDARREALALAFAFKDTNNKLAADAISSRAQMSIGERLRSWFLPQQKAVAAYIEEQDPKTKAELAAVLTPEERKWADNWTDFASQAYEYLLSVRALEGSAHKGAYIPHVRRPLREMLAGIKDGGIKGFLREFKQRFEQADADVTAVDTNGEPLGFQKFLKNTLHRTGQLTPSLNLPAVMNNYAGKLYQKVALDKLVPAVDSLALALKSEDTSIGAAESNKALKKFTDAFLNAKKGNAPWAFQQGGVVETIQRFATNMASLSYISLNFALQLASPVGATIVEIPVLGNKGLFLAKARRLTEQGRAILAKTEHRAFLGETLKEIVMEPGKTLPEQMNAAANGMWSIIHHEVMSDLLLGSMTDEEFASGKISEDRLTDIEVKAGRWIDVRGSKSIRGSSVTGAGWTQFKGWMIPPMRSTAENALALADMLAHPANKEKRITPAQALELAYIAEMTAIGLVARAALGKDNPDDDSFLEKFRHYLRGELFTHVASLNIAAFVAAPPGIAWLTRLGHNLLLLADLDEDKRARGKKGLIKQVPFASIVRPALEEKK